MPRVAPLINESCEAGLVRVDRNSVGRVDQQAQSGDSRQRGDRRYQRAVGDWGVVGDRRHPDGIQLNDAQRDLWSNCPPLARAAGA
jgi:hypothetical protein